MSEATLLLILRLLAGGLLFAFLAALAWLLYRDLQQTALAVQSEQGTQGHLRVLTTSLRGPAPDTLYPLLAVTRIGRAPGNTIVLDDDFVSAEHALLTRREKRWWLEDLGSRNGTLLNDLPLADTAVVVAGDIIAIGDVQLRVEPEGVSV